MKEFPSPSVPRPRKLSVTEKGAPRGTRTQRVNQSPPRGPEAKSPGWRKYLPGLIILAGASAYLNSFDGVFILDDEVNIVRNQHLRGLKFDWNAINYRRRPIVNLSLMINYALGELNVWGYHAFNLSVHILAGLTLFGVVRRTTDCGLRIGDCGFERGHRRQGGMSGPQRGHARHEPGMPHDALHRQSPIRKRQSATWLALTISLMWLVHPLQTQSVTYVIQRSELLMGLFYLLTLYFVIRGTDSRRPFFWYAAAVLACALGMGSKPVMLTAPVVVLLYDRVFLSESFLGMWRRRWGLYISLAATWSILIATGVVQGVLFPQPNATSHVGFGFTQISPLQYALTQPGVLIHYLELSLWPNPLCLDYAWPIAAGAAAIVPPALAVALLLVTTVWALWRKPRLGFLGAWFFLILLPTSSFIPIKDVAFEHRMYLPLAAVVALLVIVGRSVLNSVLVRLSLSGRARRIVPGGLVVIVVSMLSLASARRNDDYKSSLTMWTDVVTQRPRNGRARLNRGIALADLGRLDEAIAEYHQSLGIHPQDVLAHYNLGVALSRLGRFDEAVNEYRRAIQIDAGHLQARCNLGIALAGLGRLEEAIVEFRKTIGIDPSNLLAHFNLGSALAKMGRFDQSITSFREAVRIHPRLAAAHMALGNALVKLHGLHEAVQAYRQAARINPSHADARYLLGETLLQLGEIDDAITELRAAISIRPRDAQIRRALEAALAVERRPDTR